MSRKFNSPSGDPTIMFGGGIVSLSTIKKTDEPEQILNLLTEYEFSDSPRGISFIKAIMANDCCLTDEYRSRYIDGLTLLGISTTNPELILQINTRIEEARTKVYRNRSKERADIDAAALAVKSSALSLVVANPGARAAMGEIWDTEKITLNAIEGPFLIITEILDGLSKELQTARPHERTLKTRAYREELIQKVQELDFAEGVIFMFVAITVFQDKQISERLGIEVTDLFDVSHPYSIFAYILASSVNKYNTKTQYEVIAQIIPILLDSSDRGLHTLFANAHIVEQSIAGNEAGQLTQIIIAIIHNYLLKKDRPQNDDHAATFSLAYIEEAQYIKDYREREAYYCSLVTPDSDPMEILDLDPILHTFLLAVRDYSFESYSQIMSSLIKNRAYSRSYNPHMRYFQALLTEHLRTSLGEGYTLSKVREKIRSYLRLDLPALTDSANDDPYAGIDVDGDGDEFDVDFDDL